MPRRQCNAKRKDGSACHGPAVTGADKCRMHLGKQAAGVIIEAKAAKLLYQYDAPAVTNHLEALQWDPLESTCRHASLSIL